MKKYRLLVVLLRTNALARKPAQKLKLTHQSAKPPFRRPVPGGLHCQPTSSTERKNKMNHPLNRLTGRTGITQLTHSLVQNIKVESKIFKQTFDMNLIHKHIVRSITEKRAFQGMAGLAVLHPSVVDYIGWGLKTL